jgi:hypothetical protein
MRVGAGAHARGGEGDWFLTNKTSNGLIGTVTARMALIERADTGIA